MKDPFVQTTSQQAEPAPDWTYLFDRASVAHKANELVDELILEIHGRQLDIHKGMDAKELALLYRWPIHVGINIFIERLLRYGHSRKVKRERTYPKVLYRTHYFKDTDEAVLNHYLDYALNYHLLHQIDETFGVPTLQDNGPNIIQPRPQDALLKEPSGLRDSVKKIIKTIIEVYARISKPVVVGEYSNWMREILPFRQMLSFPYPARDYRTDEDTRNTIRDCCRAVFLRRIIDILDNMDGEQKLKLSEIFADLIDHIIPQSLVEGLAERFAYFEGMIQGWEVREVHSFIGYYYKENFKIFAILARRKGALLIGHAHGAANPASSYKQCRNELAFLDFYVTWGIRDSNWLMEMMKGERPRLINLGSTYLSGIKKWNRRTINPGELIMLYPSGPLIEFMSDLQEITPECSYQHRLRVLSLIKELLNVYPKMKVLYKPFPGTFTNDPIKSMLAREFESGSVELVDERPSTLYPAVDVVLWDCMTTGFCESLSSGVPTVVFQSKHEHERAAPLGRELDRGLFDCGMLFYDVESGVRSFNRIIDELESFLQSREEAIHEFQEATAYPVSRSEFRRTFNSALPSTA